MGVAGLVVEPMNRMALADAFERMCLHPEERAAMGVVGRERVRRFYRQEQMVETYRELYEEVTSGWRA